MSTSTISSGQLVLEGDGYGWATAVRTLPAAPSTAKRMVFVFRGWYDTFSGGVGNGLVIENNVLTDLQWLFGLRFTSAVPDEAGLVLTPQTDGGHFASAYQDFFGLASYRTSGATANRLMMQHYTETEGTMAGCMSDNSNTIYTGLFGASSSSGALHYDDQLFSSAGTEACLALPSNPTDGAKFTGVWEVYGSDVDNSVYYRVHINWDSVSTTDLLAAYGQVGTWGGEAADRGPLTIHADATGTNWRNADGSMNFPRYLMARYPFLSQQMVLDHFKVAYYDSITT